jgi:hypothetical protein
LIQEEFKRRLNSGDSFYHSVPDHSSSPLLSISIRLKYTKLIFLVVLYGCEAWPNTLREEHRLRGFGNERLKSIFGPKRVDIIGSC